MSVNGTQSDRVTDHVEIVIDGAPMRARVGHTVATALLAAGERTLRHTRKAGAPRGLYCAMGVCFECIVKVNGVTERACMRTVEHGMRIERLTRFKPAGKP